MCLSVSFIVWSSLLLFFSASRLLCFPSSLVLFFSPPLRLFLSSSALVSFSYSSLWFSSSPLFTSLRFFSSSLLLCPLPLSCTSVRCLVASSSRFIFVYLLLFFSSSSLISFSSVLRQFVSPSRIITFSAFSYSPLPISFLPPSCDHLFLLFVSSLLRCFSSSLLFFFSISLPLIASSFLLRFFSSSHVTHRVSCVSPRRFSFLIVLSRIIVFSPSRRLIICLCSCVGSSRLFRSSSRRTAFSSVALPSPFLLYF